MLVCQGTFGEKRVSFNVPSLEGVRNSCTPSPLRYALTKNNPVGSGTIM
jgi:hypothetical protein